ncbi:MAG: L-lactate dehydrogenase [Desulfosalsimonas sp.]
MTKDPVCGMEIDERQARHKFSYMGKPYYFCSRECREAFSVGPDKYLAQSPIETRTSRKIVVVGTGQVGATFAFALMTTGMASEIVLIDSNRAIAEGHAMDMNHGMPFVQPTKINPGTYEDCRGADIVVITAGAAQKPGETRLDLVRKNTEIFKNIIPEIVRQDPGILLIVSNPVDILTYVALRISGFSMNRVLGSGTVLDTARFRYLLSRHCGVDARNVQAFVAGEHGDTEVPVWSQVNIAGMNFDQYCAMSGLACQKEDQQLLFNQVKQAAYEIINRKGYTNHAIALGLIQILSSILRGENSVLTVSSLIDGYYDTGDVCMSLPAVLNQNGIQRQLFMELSDEEISLFRHSAKTLKEVIAQIDI